MANLTMKRKRRTRGHIIADLSVNHVERHILRCGFSTELTRHDYGIDMLLFFYDRRGAVREGQAYIQVKATDHLRTGKRGTSIPFDVDRRDLDFWLGVAQPVILVIYDARADRAFWLYVQSGLRPTRTRSTVARTVRLHVPIENVLDEDAVRTFARYNDSVVEQLNRALGHEE